MRRKDREVKDPAAIRGILAGCQVMRLAMVEGTRPYIVPLNFGWQMASDGQLTLYFHSAAQGRKIDILAANPEVCFELDRVEAMITAEEACEFGCAYASIIGEGTARRLEDAAEKAAALNRIMLQVSGRDDFTFPPAMLKATAVYSVTASGYTAKRCPAT